MHEQDDMIDISQTLGVRRAGNSQEGGKDPSSASRDEHVETARPVRYALPSPKKPRLEMLQHGGFIYLAILSRVSMSFGGE